MKLKEKSNSELILMVLTGYSVAFVVAGVVAAIWKGELNSLIPGFVTICTSPSQFTRDYFQLGTLGGAFLNTGMVGLACCGLLFFTKAKCSGLTVAAFWLNVGFGTFGMNFVNIWPFFLGVWVYSRIKKVPYGSVANQAMFATALAPFASELLFRYPHLETVGFSGGGLILAIALGIFVGCVMPPLLAHIPNFHKGFDLYSAGPAAGFLAFFVYCVLFRSPGVADPKNTSLGDGERLFVNVFFILAFAACFAVGYIMDKDSIKNYKNLLASDGYKTDYTEKFGFATTMINMGVYGFFILLYFNIVQGMSMVDGNLVFTGAKFTGATMGAIMCMYAFCAQGTQPRTVFPILVGYGVASLFPFFMYVSGASLISNPEMTGPNWTLTTQAILVGACFSSGLAPISGKFGFIPGVIAGAMHATMVMSVPLWHSGFCLYNGGWTAGLVAFLLVPVLECFFEKAGEKTVGTVQPNLKHS